MSAAAEAPHDQTIDGRYDVLEALGEGAMGTVYRVLDTSGGRELALKRVRSVDDAVTRRHRSELLFRREFHTLARLEHPRIVEVHDYGHDGGRPYYTMELLDGADLHDAGELDVRDSCAVLRDVASALAFLHARRLLHRDLKDRNVRLTGDGRAKLMDFGVLATMGVAGEIAGTPPNIAPESVQGLPLDGRADLFGLGALAYHLLTGHHAFPARTIHELPTRWKVTPPAPSDVRAEVPTALDDLVLSLLSVEPAGRPATAAEIIDRLTVIGELEPDPDLHVARGWLSSAALVGREHEMARLREAVRAGVEGSGRVVVIEASTGTGKTRLLREAGLEGQLAGALVLSAKGMGQGGAPYEVLRQLIRELFRRSPAQTSFRFGAHASVIARVVPEVGLPQGIAAATSDPAEERLRQQQKLAQWLTRLAKQRPLVLAVDELHRADEASVSLLATLANGIGDLPLTIVAARRTDEPTVAQAATEALTGSAQVLALRGLDRVGVGRLIRNLFGDAGEADAVGDWAHRVAGGNPMLIMELARSLVDRELVRYADGRWVLPRRLDEVALPVGLTDAMDQRIGRLSGAARGLAEAVAVLGDRTPLDLCMAMTGIDEEHALFEALDELVFEEVLVGGDLQFGFRHDGLREAVLRGLPEERRQSLHRRAAEVLAGRDEKPTPEQETAIGWHWLRGGEPGRGAELLEAAGRRLYEVQSLFDAIAPLQSALEVYEARGEAGSRRCLELRRLLMRAGVLTDRGTVLRLADDTIAAFDRVTGMARARRYSSGVGRLLALLLALLGMSLAWLFGGGSRRRWGPLDGLTAYLALANYAASVYSLAYATRRVEEIEARLDPLLALRGRVPEGAVLIVQNFRYVAVGRWSHLRDNAQSVLAALQRDRLTPLSEIDGKLARGTMHYMVASVDALEMDPGYERAVEELEALDLRFFDMACCTARALFHRMRGEEALAEGFIAESEAFGVQLGNAWVFDSQLSWVSAMAYSLSRDVPGLKRAVEHMQRLVRGGYQLEAFVGFATAEYLRLCGDPKGALEELDTVAIPRDNLLLAQLVAVARAEALLTAERAEDARRVAGEGLGLQHEGDRGMQVLRTRLSIVEALAETAAGDAEAGRTKLADLLVRVEALASPVLSGAVHEALATACRVDGDLPAAGKHASEAQALFRGTRNAALVSRAERIGRRPSREVELVRDDENDATLHLAASDAGSLTDEGRGPDPSADAGTQIDTTLGPSRTEP